MFFFYLIYLYYFDILSLYWVYLEVMLGHFGILALYCSILALRWPYFDPMLALSWTYIGFILGHPGQSWPHLGPSWHHHGPILAILIISWPRPYHGDYFFASFFLHYFFSSS